MRYRSLAEKMRREEPFTVADYEVLMEAIEAALAEEERRSHPQPGEH